MGTPVVQFLVLLTNVLTILLLTNLALADQVGVVINTPAYVYQKSDFDSQIISELPLGNKIRISNKKWGAFFRTQTAQGTIGYVSDGDVKPTKGKLEPLLNSKGAKVPATKKTATAKTDTPSAAKRTPWWASSMLGFEVGYLQYSEIVAKLQYGETAMAYGLKYSFPFRLLDGPVHMDINVLVHPAAPGYYSQISSTAPSGYYASLDAPLFFSVGNFWGKEGAVNFGIGPLFNFSNYSVTLAGQPAQLEALRVGAVLGLEFAFKLGSSFALKIEPRYYFEQQNYWVGIGSLQLLL